MRTRRNLAVIAALCLVAYTSGAYERQGEAVRRFGLFVGANDGGGTRVTLRYALDDARSLAQVMEEIGGIDPADRSILVDPDGITISRQFDVFRAMIDSAHRNAKRVEFVFYYSGHSDETGLLLGDEVYEYRRLRGDLEDIEADVRIAILDSCSSGAFTRLKGGTRRSPFLVDDSADMKGHAYLTSSSADEASQESDRIGASFFTHYMVAGLRGAADTTNDRQITLNELYQYAFAETLYRTENTHGGPQHPSYEIQLSGTGDLVLTDLRSTEARIGFHHDLEGRLHVRDARGRLVAELSKKAGSPISLAVPPGTYEVTLNQDRGTYQTQVSLRLRDEATLTSGDFAATLREVTRLRGNSPPVETEVPAPFSLTLLPGLSLGMSHGNVRGIAVDMLPGATANLDGIQLSPTVNVVRQKLRGGQLAGIGNVVQEGATGFQVSGVFNTGATYVEGMQYTGVFNAADRLDGAQVAGVFNIADEDAQWAQLAGVFNAANGSFRGAQVASVWNRAGLNLAGAQVAGVFNQAHSIRGAQISLLNIAGSMHGVQFGLINVADSVSGAQVGLVNFSRFMRGVPIGLLNVAQNGLLHLGYWGDENNYDFFALQTGSRLLYTLMYAGVEGIDSIDSLSSLALGMGLGVRLSSDPLYLEIDASVKYLPGEDWWKTARTSAPELGRSFPSLRGAIGIDLFGNLSVFGGVSVDLTVPGLLPSVAPFHDGTHYDFPVSGYTVEAYPTFFGGFKL